MTIEILRDTLFWCFIINLGLLLWWVFMFIAAHDSVYRIHSRWFTISTEKFDSIHYAGMAFFKICIFFFNLAPYFALRIAG